MNFIEFINTLVPLSDAVSEELLSRTRKLELPPHYLLSKEGEICDDVFFVEKGLVRWYYYDQEGRDISDSFAAENSFVTGFDSFFQRKPSRYFIETLEDSVVSSMSYKDLEDSFEEFREIEKVGRIILIQIIEQILEKNAALSFQNAEQRYRFITDKYPNLLERVPLGHIASYLGITQETLSRIRAKRI